ncbi:MAG: hypothetical protein DRI36_01775, partial [Caldiserica bacterium]
VSDIAADQIYSGGLSNTAEHLILKDSSGNIIDEVDCSSGWFISLNRGESMERMNPAGDGSDSSNWAKNNGVERNGLDANGTPINGTPKAQNSVFIGSGGGDTGVVTSSITLTLSTKIFYPMGDVLGKPSTVQILWNVPTGTVLNLKVFNLKGSSVRILVKNKDINTSQDGSSGVLWDGKDNSGNTLPPGIYIVYLEVLNTDTGKRDVVKKCIVIGRKL